VRLSVGRTGSCHGNAVAEPSFGTPRNERHRHERPADASTAKHRAVESIEPYCSRCRPHGSIGDRVPAEAMKGFSGRFGRALAYDPEAMEAA
jgi:transposase InsO family protein